MSRLRTALIAWDYPPSASGLAVAAREIAESLAAAGAEAHVYTLDRQGSEVIEGVRVIGCQPPEGGAGPWLRRRAAIGHLVAPRWFAARIAADHRQRPFDCLEATNWYAPGAFASRIPDLPFVTRHSTPAISTGAISGGLRDRMDGRYACRLEATTARRSAGHIFNTQSHGEKVRALYGLDEAAPQAVIGLSLPPERLARAAGAPYPPAGEELRLLSVGRAEARKGFDCLMGALAILADEVATGALPRFRLDLVGIGAEDLPPLDDRARSCLTLHGRLDDAALDAAYREADLVVAPSRYESFGLVYQEALAFGRPVIGLSVDPSARRVVGDSGAGLLAADASGAALADVLRPALGDADLRLQLHRRAVAAAGRFTRQTLGKETLALYEAAREFRRQSA
ncbi:possible glucosyltransferase [Aurantimonas manganoxydans SI85-9A1]|uniref:Possible glucosyltransferase n=1 Tax=Aurantimonas manganoxydans (strain ATCC BAA-1229 / DSM 21871 / SI85-9A1) TaxID=287752 RepID=Q1YKU0_AURMS|nr:glycosyltransferase family 4 protein [Aurantimonas manganoxydans]EAS50433.1 possible glucosyltransferase [Aurantimonas manganoxydans SI85-9A1]